MYFPDKNLFGFHPCMHVVVLLYQLIPVIKCNDDNTKAVVEIPEHLVTF